MTNRLYVATQIAAALHGASAECNDDESFYAVITKRAMNAAQFLLAAEAALLTRPALQLQSEEVTLDASISADCHIRPSY